MPVPTIFDFSSPRYAVDTAGFFIALRKYFPTGKQVPGVHYDGDFTKAARVGIGVPEHPWAKNGDRNSAIVREPWMQLGSSYVPLAFGTKNPDDARLLLIDECDFRDLGGGVVGWTRVWAKIPQNHDEMGSRSHGYQYLRSRSPLTVDEKQIKVASRTRREFFHISEFQNYPPLLASRFEEMTDALTLERGDTTWNVTATGLFVTSEQEIVAEDSEILLWHYPIMYRETVYVKGPTQEFWGRAFSLLGG